MQQRTLGRRGLTVSEIGYGAMTVVPGYGPTDDERSIAAIRRARELGVTHFDTAALYGAGDGERLLGRALAPFRDEVTIATKFGYAANSPTFAPDSSPRYIRETVDASLRNLGVDAIDLLYQHVADPAVPVEEVVGVMTEFVDAGKVRFLGLSNTDEESIRRAHAVHPVTAVQFEYSIFAHAASDALLPTLDELGIGLVGYTPLARGFLSGAVRSRAGYDDHDRRQVLDRWAPENFDANLAIVTRLEELAAEKRITLAQLAIAWVLAQPAGIVPIPGSSNPDRVAENLAAARVELTPDDLARILEIAPNGAAGRPGM